MAVCVTCMNCIWLFVCLFVVCFHSSVKTLMVRSELCEILHAQVFSCTHNNACMYLVSSTIPFRLLYTNVGGLISPLDITDNYC